ncbi:CPBP family glutamic-type intramembrane protease [Enhygromyxa salina]|uniref:CAAX amino terminal protease self-immunity n=1 Tax=Enhygromyxa salina TaxID=215803 RepID=A0A2S9Y7X7_9BACT|nr:NAD(P)H-binding protein [Enhygromyxa salina]PRQ01209.1 CAAX amino terminal protease self- immunity [Enhygromyxa salina]
MDEARTGCLVIAVAGGTGFVGRHVVAQLLAAGHAVVVLARAPHGLPSSIADARLRAVDLSRGVDPQLLEGCEILINLVGIKRETAGWSWERAHVELPEQLAEAARRAGLSRMIHVSVAGSDRAGAGAGAYLDSKARGDQRLRARTDGPAITILRPGVIYGRGDDLLRNLADSIRAAPVFPAPRGGRSSIQPIAVEDLADAVMRCVEQPASSGRDYDLVGPERLELRELVDRVASCPVVARRCVVVPAPLVVQRAVARVLERASADPLITRSQLELLAAGVVGDPEPARTELGLQPDPLDRAAITHALAEFKPRLPSVRLVPDPAAALELRDLAGHRTERWRLAWFAALAVGGLLAGPWLPGSVWTRMAGLEGVLSLLALTLLGLRWARLWRPSAAALGWGVGAGVVMWAGAFGVAAALARLAPELWSETTTLYAWSDQLTLAPPLALGLLTLIVAGEEVVWRGALGVALAGRSDRMGPWSAVLLSSALFTIAHLSTGPPVLAIAAALAGGAWTWLAIRTRSLFAPFVAHLGWDAALLWLTPLS